MESMKMLGKYRIVSTSKSSLKDKKQKQSEILNM